MSEEKTCPGCGAVLQTIDDQAEGYIPAPLYNNPDAICQRCFQLQHYGRFTSVPIANEELMKIFKTANAEKSLLVYVIDIFNFYGSIIENLAEIVPDSPIFVIVNKFDLLPRSLKEERIIQWVKNRLAEQKVKFVDIVLISTINNRNVDGLFDRIMQYANNNNVYVIGNANVGKSSVINVLLKQYNNLTSQYITSSVFPGTTLNVVKIPFSDKNYLYDTPGLMVDKCIYKYLDGKNLKRVINSKEINPVNMTVYPGQSLFIGTVACIDIIEGDNTPLIVYGSNGLKYHRTKLALSAEKFSSLENDPLYLPKANCHLSKATMDCHEIKIDTKQRISIVISGLVWVDVLKGRLTMKVYVPRGIEVIKSNPLIGGNVNETHK